MVIIYHCFGGSHSSVTAAALHLELIDKKKLPDIKELLLLPYFDKTTDDDFGNIRFMGVDEFNNKIYVLGRKCMMDRFTGILTGLADILGKKDQLMVVNCMTPVNWKMKIGGFVSRRMGLVSVGRPILEIGTKHAFMELVHLVDVTKESIIKKLRAEL